MTRKLLLGRFRVTLATLPKNVWKKNVGISLFAFTVFPNKPFKGVKIVVYPLSLTIALMPKDTVQ